MQAMTMEKAFAIAKALFPHIHTDTSHSGSFLSPAIRWHAKRRLEEIAYRIIAVVKNYNDENPGK